MTKRSLRQQDADALRRQLARTGQAIDDLRLAWGVWADDVRQEAEHRHGLDATDQTLWADPEYSAALNVGGPALEAAEAIQRAAALFTSATTPTAQTPVPETEPEAES